MKQLKNGGERDDKNQTPDDEEPNVVPITPDSDGPEIIPSPSPKEIKTIIDGITREHIVWDGHLSPVQRKPGLPS